MPTGYTACIGDGVSFEEFVLGCARAFGACVTMRDDPSDKPIPDRFEPSDYYSKGIVRANDRIEELKKMSTAEAEAGARAEYEKELQDKEEGIRRDNELRSKYAAMLSKVEAWRPPTTDHKELKKFMIDQIEGSIDFDCGGDYWVKKSPVLLSAQRWLEKELTKAMKDLAYYTKENIKENERVEGRNAWVKALRDSLE